MKAPSLEEAIFSQRFIRQTILVAAIFLVVMVAGNIVFCIIFPNSPLLFRFQFDVDQEGNWVTWFSSTLDLAAGGIAMLVAWLSKRIGMQRTIAFSRRWLAIGGILIYFGMDDAAQIHEYIYALVKRVTPLIAQWLPGILQVGWYIWLPVLGITGLVFLYGIARVIYRDTRSNRLARWLVIGALALWLSYPITESIQSRLPRPAAPGGAQIAGQLDRAGRQAWLQVRVVELAQEAAEVMAAVCLLAAFLLIGQDMITMPKANVHRAAIPLISREVFRASKIGKYA